MSVSIMLNQASTALQDYNSPKLQAASKRIYCWRLRRYIRVLTADMGQKPRITPASGNESLLPEFSQKMRISGLRRDIVELLQEQGPMRIDAIISQLESKPATVVSQLTRNPEFHCDGTSKNSMWYLDTEWLQSAVEAGQAVIEKTPQETVADYITAHGPSTVAALTKVLGRDARHVLKQHFTVVEPERPAVWGLTKRGQTTELSYRSVAAKAIDAIREHGPMTVDDIATKLDIERRSVLGTMCKYTNYFTRTQPHQYARWGFK